MSSCERCWADAYDPYGNQSERYQDRLQYHHCTPEQQAGPGADQCFVCKRWTLHQYTNEPMCGCAAPEVTAPQREPQ